MFQNERGSSPLFSESAFSRSPLLRLFIQIFRRKNRQRIRATKYIYMQLSPKRLENPHCTDTTRELTSKHSVFPHSPRKQISACIQAKLSVSCGRHTCPLPGGGY